MMLKYIAISIRLKPWAFTFKNIISDCIHKQGKANHATGLEKVQSILCDEALFLKRVITVWTIERSEGKRDDFSNARRGSRKGVSMRKSRCTDVGITLENSIKRSTEVYKPGASSCNDEHGNLVTDLQRVQRLWRKHFSSLLQGDDDTNTAFRDIVKLMIMPLKTNKAADSDDLPGSNDLVGLSTKHE